MLHDAFRFFFYNSTHPIATKVCLFRFCIKTCMHQSIISFWSQFWVLPITHHEQAFMSTCDLTRWTIRLHCDEEYGGPLRGQSVNKKCGQNFGWQKTCHVHHDIMHFSIGSDGGIWLLFVCSPNFLIILSGQGMSSFVLGLASFSPALGLNDCRNHGMNAKSPCHLLYLEQKLQRSVKASSLKVLEVVSQGMFQQSILLVHTCLPVHT